MKESEKSVAPKSPLPQPSLPKGGGALAPIGEKLAPHPQTGTASFAIPLPITPGRGGFGPHVGLSYDSGAGVGTFGIGWNLGVPSIVRRTDRGLPRYPAFGSDDDDEFLYGGEALVALGPPVRRGDDEVIAYRPRVDGEFARIERRRTSGGIDHWVVLGRDNVRQVFGFSAQARVSDPDAPARVFRWNLEWSDDDRGNVVAYHYKAEESAGSYLKAIGYLNRAPRTDRTISPIAPGLDGWPLVLLFDYGEHDLAAIAAGGDPFDEGTWTERVDPFSNRRATFEIRTRRLCRNVLMLHRIDDTGAYDAAGPHRVTRSLGLAYTETDRCTYLRTATTQGWRWRAATGDHEVAAFPSLTFGYSTAEAPDITSRLLDAESLDGASDDLETVHLVDYDGEGLPGVLDAGDGAWWYKRPNGLDTPAWSPPSRIAKRPAVSLDGAQLQDWNGDGSIDVVQLHGGTRGVFERQPRPHGTDLIHDDWRPFRPFSVPEDVDFGDHRLRFVDLTGDGFSDAVFVDDDRIRWHRAHAGIEARGHDGFGAERRVPLPDGVRPRLDQALFVADMTGDGLADLVEVTHGSCAYWPNLGYGRFGQRVVMRDAPILSSRDDFDPARVRFGDFDGTGTADLVYLDGSYARIYPNCAGNRFGDAIAIPMTSPARIELLDLWGRGTATLLWASDQRRDRGRRFRYVDLFEVKPHLLISIDNGHGLTQQIDYAPSTKFYLADRRSGRPWVTRLPFPVQVIERLASTDAVTGARLATTFAYHHGHYDGAEREFRGFAMVEQTDTDDLGALAGTSHAPPEALDLALHRPPVVTKTWFHTGAYAGHDTISRALAGEYFAGDPDGVALADTVIPEGLTPEEERECVRALRGKPLRVEVYADDGTSLAGLPYTVAEHAYTLIREQPRLAGRHGVFSVHARESLSYQYERELSDPRISHELVVRLSPCGTPIDTVAIAYPRRATTAFDWQQRAAAALTHVELRDPELDSESNRRDVVVREDRFELVGLSVAKVLSFSQVSQFVGAASEQPYTPLRRADDGALPAGKNLLARTRHRYVGLDGVGLLAQDSVAARVLPGRTEQLAHTAKTLEAIAAREPTLDLAAVLVGRGGYLADGDGTYWAASPTATYDALAFFVPVSARDVFDAETRVEYDELKLFPVHAWDAMQNLTTFVRDYRVWAPSAIVDPNGTQLAVDVDARGIVVATYERRGALGGRTSAIDYAFYKAGQPAWVHVQALRNYDATAANEIEHAWVYADGFGREALRKQQVPPGPLVLDDASTFASPRFVGTGRTVFDNKANPVKKYEPYFSDNAGFESEAAIVDRGVTPVTRYDSLSRPIRADLPDGSFTDIANDPWMTTARDAIDTLDVDVPWYAERHALSATDPERIAAEAAFLLRGTPTVTHLDVLGRPTITAVDNQEATPLATVQEHDLLGSVLAVTDPRGITVSVTRYDAAARAYEVTSVDAGETTTLLDAAGAPLLVWRGAGDSRVRMAHRYDLARRAIEVRVVDRTVAASADLDGGYVRERAIYRDQVQGAIPENSAGRLFAELDGAGSVTTRYDFAGNAMRVERRVAKEFAVIPEWSSAAAWTGDMPADVDALLEDEIIGIDSTFDAHRRLVTQSTPDGRLQRRAYDVAGRLAQVGVERSGAVEQVVVASVSYDQKGRRVSFVGGHGATTTYHFDPLTFRLRRLETSGAGQQFQDLEYTYDAVGNVARIVDAAQDTLYFANTKVSPEQVFEYDAIYRLTSASGRENRAQAKPDQHLIPAPMSGIPASAPTDLAQLTVYTETYGYDRGGNIEYMRHVGGDSWTRDYAYEAGSNRLATTSIGGAAYTHDSRGNMEALPHLPAMLWNHKDQMVATTRTRVVGAQLQDLPLATTTNPVYFAYDLRGQRVRKVSVDGAVVRTRIYVGSYEVYRELTSGTPTVHTTTLSVMDDQSRVAIVEATLAADLDRELGVRWRFQHANQLGSAILELSNDLVPLSYEEYHPYGTIALSALQTDTPPRRYRFTGMERDEETGLQCHGVRYYAPWLARWVSADPAGVCGGTSLYAMAASRPTALVDRDGRVPSAPAPKVANLIGYAYALVFEPVVPGKMGPIEIPMFLSESTESFEVSYGGKAALTAKNNVAVRATNSTHPIRSMYDSGFKLKSAEIYAVYDKGTGALNEKLDAVEDIAMQAAAREADASVTRNKKPAGKWSLRTAKSLIVQTYEAPGSVLRSRASFSEWIRGVEPQIPRTLAYPSAATARAKVGNSRAGSPTEPTQPTELPPEAPGVKPFSPTMSGLESANTLCSVLSVPSIAMSMMVTPPPGASANEVIGEAYARTLKLTAVTAGFAVGGLLLPRVTAIFGVALCSQSFQPENSAYH